MKPINKKGKSPGGLLFTVSSRALMSAPDLTIMMALQWLIKSRGHAFFWSSYLCETHTYGHTGSISIP